MGQYHPLFNSFLSQNFIKSIGSEMNIATIQKQPNIENIQQLCPLKCSMALCLNQLRTAKIQFLNLGNLIVCPAQNCLIIFKYKTLVRIAALTNT